WLFMCDTDMVLEPDTIDRLVAAADPVEVPVLGGLCWSLEAGVKVPTMYELVQKDGGQLAFARHSRWPDDGMVRVSATGAACLLIHRSALHRVQLHSDDQVARWFRDTALRYVPLALMGE